MTTQQKHKLTHTDLHQFWGTSQYYQVSPLFPALLLTDGTRYLAEKGECYWLFEKIASLQEQPAIKNNVDCLMTWNCKHIANAEIEIKIIKIYNSMGYTCPLICTPLELMDRWDYEEK